MNTNIQLLKDQFKDNLYMENDTEEYSIIQYCPNDKGLHPIHKLVFFPDLLKLYLTVNSNKIDILTGKNKFSPLILAIRNDIKSSVDLILKYGANINILYKYGDTSLMFLFYNICSNSFYYTKLLLEKGIDINKQNNHGSTALLYVCMETIFTFHKVIKLKCIKLLLENDANIYIETSTKQTCLMIHDDDFTHLFFPYLINDLKTDFKKYIDKLPRRIKKRLVLCLQRKNKELKLIKSVIYRIRNNLLIKNKIIDKLILVKLNNFLKF